MGRDYAEGYAVEHRTFGKLLDQLKELTAAQAEKVVAALRRRGDGDAVRRVIEQRALKLPNARVAARRIFGAMAWSMDCSAIAALGAAALSTP